MEIRLATVKDLPAVSILYRRLFDEMSRLQPRYFQGNGVDNEFLLQAMEEAENELFVAEEAGEVVGFAYMKEMETNPYGPYIPLRYGLLLDLAVDPAHRGKGVGTRLIQKGEEWSRQRRLDYMELNVLSNNTDAVRLYRRYGFQPSVQVMKRPLHDPED